ncbi:MAG: biopolymer transporter ExbD [Robiginitomaculum sp.]|nr:biopolymer transporter ExbD [Robiginitomaculum sp.]MDQ7078061.1 biopolymer transporter ExbD [Robiginitomaculum sp.]
MRRGGRHREQEEVEVDMTPMLDIVFILLIFFIVTAVFVQERSISLVPPPPSKNDEPQKSNPVILIQITDRDVVFVNDQLTDVRRVGPAIERFRADKGDSAILIVPDDEASHGVVITVFDAAKNTGAPTMIQRQKDGA